MSETHKLRVFLCHTTQDKPIIRQLSERLEAEGWIDPWVDEEKLVPGMDWNAEVEKAVSNSDAIIVCLSKHALPENKYIQRELKFVVDHALEKAHHPIFMIPIRLDDCEIPRHVQSWQYFDFSVYDGRRQAYNRLIKSLEIKANFDPNLPSRNGSAHIVSSGNWRERDHLAPDALKEFDFVDIPRGKFLMGSKVTNSRAIEDEFPQHPCYIQYDYQISRYAITNEQFGEFAVSTKRTDVLMGDWRSKLRQPGTNVTWHDALAYVNWLNKVYGKELDQGLVFRLPTEAEWERAARGDFGQEWPWGDESLDQLIAKELSYDMNRLEDLENQVDFSSSDEVLNFFAKVFKFDKTVAFRVNSTGKKETTTGWIFKPRVDYAELEKKIAYLRFYKPGLIDVGTFSPLTDSPYQVGDMMGSVIEWTQSLYAVYPYDSQDGRERLGGDGKRVIRGLFAPGNERFSVRCAKRFCAYPHEKDRLLGFRIVIAPPT